MGRALMRVNTRGKPKATTASGFGATMRGTGSAVRFESLITRNKSRIVVAAVAVPACLLSLGGTPHAAAQPMVYTQSGDVRADSVVVWARCNRERPGRITVELSTSAAFAVGDRGDVPTEQQAEVGADTDYTGAVEFHRLAPGTTYFHRVRCAVTAGDGADVEDIGPVGRLRTAPAKQRDAAVRFVWTADVGGQGWGRNPDLRITGADGRSIAGGYVMFEVIGGLDPDFVLLQGDAIYADNPIVPHRSLPPVLGGGSWRNEPGKDFVAVTLDQFRASWKYNLADAKLRALLLRAPVYMQWDDHEVTDNWYPGETLPAGAPYHGLSADVLAQRARRALREYTPIAGPRIHRRFRHGRHLELFLLDARSFRGPNTANTDPGGSEMLGDQQFRWLTAALAASDATWKVIASHDPLSIPTGSADDRDGWAQGDPQVLGREVQLAKLLAFLHHHGIGNVVFLSGDVHYAAAIHYDPARAVFKAFPPFWEFVAGPAHAGAFGPGELDPSFGPRYAYVRAPGTEGYTVQNLPPPRLQSFGAVAVDTDGMLTVRLHDITGTVLYQHTLQPK